MYTETVRSETVPFALEVQIMLGRAVEVIAIEQATGQSRPHRRVTLEAVIDYFELVQSPEIIAATQTALHQSKLRLILATAWQVTSTADLRLRLAEVLEGLRTLLNQESLNPERLSRLESSLSAVRQECRREHYRRQHF